MEKTINFSNLVINVQEQDELVVYTFDGDVDENFRQEQVPRIQKKKIILELANIKNFNSCGIREWIFFIRDISALGSLVFKECSVSMVDQINLVPDSLGGGKINSLYAPYYCDCQGEVNRLIDYDGLCKLMETKTAPVFECEKCGKELEFDALEESYFLFTSGGLSQVG